MTKPTTEQLGAWETTKANFEQVLADPNISKNDKEQYEYKLRAVSGLLEGKTYDV